MSKTTTTTKSFVELNGEGYEVSVSHIETSKGVQEVSRSGIVGAKVITESRYKKLQKIKENKLSKQRHKSKQDNTSRMDEIKKVKQNANSAIEKLSQLSKLSSEEADALKSLIV